MVADMAEDTSELERIESAITASEDVSSEAAFTAGFKTAMQLIMEVIA